jgi:hypothetical protein
MHLTYIIVIILLVIIILLYNKRENFLVNTEAVGNIASVYADASGVANFNNIRTNYIKTQNIDVLNNINILQNKVKLNNVDISGNVDINGNMNITKNVDISGNLNVNGKIYSKQNIARYIRIGNKLTSGIDSVDSWTIHEVEVYDSTGINIALNKGVAVISGQTAYPNNNEWGIAANITNGNAKALDGDSYHGNADKNHELEIDLGQEYDIKQIIVHNRYHSSYVTHANNTSIQLLDKNKNVNRVIFTGNWLHTYSKEYLL